MILDCCKRRLAFPYAVIETIVTADASTPAIVAKTCFIASAIVKNTSSERGNMSSALTTGASTGFVDGSGVVVGVGVVGLGMVLVGWGVVLVVWSGMLVVRIGELDGVG